MMKEMKILAILALAAAVPPVTQLGNVRSVYLFPMASGFDQYVASELASHHVLQVVTDPKSADAILTDRLGTSFEQLMDEKVFDVKSKNDIPHSSLGTRRGTLFLVSRSKQVLWSTTEPVKDSSSKQMVKAARRCVEHLKDALQPQAPSR